MDRASFRLELIKLTYRPVGIMNPTETAVSEAKKLEEYLYSESGNEKPVEQSVAPVKEIPVAQLGALDISKPKNKGR